MSTRCFLERFLYGTNACLADRFNPVAITLLRKAANSLLDKAFASPAMVSHERPSKDVVDMVLESANGDIRSAVMALQFACVVDLPSTKGKGKGKAKAKDRGAAKGVYVPRLESQSRHTETSFRLEAITRREQSLALFHLLGKLMYNKRKHLVLCPVLLCNRSLVRLW